LKLSLKKRLRKLRELPHPWRMLSGVLLIIGGLVWFLPIVGIWMIPLGLWMLSKDFPWARRWHLNLVVWWRRFRTRFLRKNKTEED